MSRNTRGCVHGTQEEAELLELERLELPESVLLEQGLEQAEE